MFVFTKRFLPNSRVKENFVEDGIPVLIITNITSNMKTFNEMEKYGILISIENDMFILKGQPTQKNNRNIIIIPFIISFVCGVIPFFL